MTKYYILTVLLINVFTLLGNDINKITIEHKNSDITITVNETSTTQYNEINGVLFWDINLQPNEIKKIKLYFTIKNLKDRNIAVKNYRTISSPSF